MRLEDIEDFYAMQSNMEVMRYIKPPLNYEESKVELEKFIGYYTSDLRYFLLWAIEGKVSGDFVGICGVYENERKEKELAYRLRKPFWGKGIGGEVAKGLISYCFNGIGLKEVVASADEDNVGSVKILEREMEFVERVYSEGRGCFARKYKLNFEG